MPHATHPSPGLQALILCGPGISLNTFTSDPNTLPKALLPIANRPMIYYPLHFCHRMGITDITLITPPESAPPLETALATHPALTGLRYKPEVLAPENLEQTTGTGEILGLAEVQNAIVGDFVVLPCDLISEVEGSRVLEQWMALNPLSLPSQKNERKRKGGMAVYYPTTGLEGISTKKDETDFLATVPLPLPTVPSPSTSLREKIEEVVMYMPTDTLNDKLEEDEGFLRLRQSLLSKHGKVRMRMKYRDAHFYILPYWVKEWLARKPDTEGLLETLGEDVLGWWAKARWQGDALAEKLGLLEVLGERKQSNREANGYIQDQTEELDVASLSSTHATPAPPQQEEGRTTFASRVTSPPSLATPLTPAPPQLHQGPISIPPLLAYIHPTPPPTSTSTLTNSSQSAAVYPLIRRIDTTPQLTSLSLYLARQPATHPLVPEHKIHPTASIGQQSRISAEDCLIAENVTLGIRCNIKESVIGANCEIGNNVRMVKCVLMDGVVVGDGVQMTGCIIGRRARIESVKAATTEGGAVTTEGETQSTQTKKARRKGGEDGEEEGKTRLTECEVAPGFVVESGTEAKGEKMMGFETGGLEDEDHGEDEEGIEDE